MSILQVSNPVLEIVDTTRSKTEQGPLQTKGMEWLHKETEVAIPSTMHSLSPTLPFSSGCLSPRTEMHFFLQGCLRKMRREAGWVPVSFPFLEVKMVNKAVSHH